ncbi:MAG: helix-turn-helix domain-containing protein [Bacteroidales bacterium]|nr:helix-turn-helix domain-containing protein [Bacteroidales bacterium]MCF8457074.1 helix-turn-helix domain-containing protein [Bacteroidales bacterium]
MDNIIANNEYVLDDFNPPEIARKISLRARELRLAKNLTQEALAKRSGVSLGSLKRFETSYEISLKHLLQLALALDALDGFHDLFQVKLYDNLDQVIQSTKKNTRKRGRNG